MLSIVLAYRSRNRTSGLADRTAAEVYEPSPRPYPEKLLPVEYPGHFEVRYVSANGGIKWHDKYLFISNVLIGEYVGFEEIDDGIWSLYFGPVLLARFDERQRRLNG